MRSKGQLSFRVKNFNQNLCVLTHLRYKTCLKKFSFCHLEIASVVGLGVLAGQNFERGDLRWRPSTVRSSCNVKITSPCRISSYSDFLEVFFHVYPTLTLMMDSSNLRRTTSKETLSLRLATRDPGFQMCTFT